MTAIDCPTFLTFTHLTPSMRKITSSYRVHIWYEKTRMAGLQSGEGRLMIDSVVWAQYINVTDRQPHRHSKCRTKALHRKAKTSSTCTENQTHDNRQSHGTQYSTKQIWPSHPPDGHQNSYDHRSRKDSMIMKTIYCCMYSNKTNSAKYHSCLSAWFWFWRRLSRWRLTLHFLLQQTTSNQSQSQKLTHVTK